jgi:3-mercaptopyruvate sulfurtransferase SseA
MTRRPARTTPALLIAAALAFLGAGCQRETRDTDIKLIRIAEVKHLADRQGREGGHLLLLVDPRPAKYYDQAHLPGARNLRLPQFDPKANVDPALDRFGTIIVYGDNPASPEARGMTKRLMAIGYGGVRLFAGGMREWMARGYPLDGHGHPPAPAPAPEAPVAAPATAAPPEAPSPPGSPEPVTPEPPPPATPPGSR